MDYTFVAVVSVVGAVLVIPAFLRERTKRAGFDLVARALERGQALDPDTILRITEEKSRTDRRRGNFALGVVLLALAVGALGSAGIVAGLEQDAQFQDFLVPATVLGVVGLAFLLLAATDKPDRNADR
jgi:hypothetical protein